MGKIKYTLIVFLIFFIINTNSANAVDSSGTWEQVGSLSTARTVPGIALLQNGEVIIAGGYNGSILKSSEIYNPASKNWRATGNLNIPRMLFVGPNMITLSDGRVIVAAGEGPTFVTGLSSTEIYNSVHGIWTSVADSNIGRFRAVVASLPNNKLLLAAGHTGGVITASAEIYDPANDRWSFTGNMNIGREGNLTFVVLNDGKVMIAGGKSSIKFAEDTAEIYDPNTGQWTLTSMPYEMNYGTLTLLQNGKVLAVGGYNGIVAVSSTALYDPSSNTWANAAPLPSPRAGHMALLLSDGNILIFGGDNVGTFYRNSVIYHSATDTWTAGPSLPTNFNTGVSIKLQNGDYLITAGYDGSIPPSATYLFTSGVQDVNLNVPLLKQTSVPWNNQTYDSANIWSPSRPTISSWGCALTSAAMVFQYHKITKLPDNSSLNPGTLNAWLNSQQDGYVRNGLVNWLALSRLSKLAKSINGISSFNALEYRRINSYNSSQLTTDINNGIPGILEEPGHFIVAKGINGSTFNINDPYYPRSSLADYSNSFLSLGRFIPSHSDLSYIMAVVDDGINIGLKTASDSAVGESFSQAPLDEDGSSLNSGDPVKILYFPQPDSGNYSLNLSSGSSQFYKLELYLYDNDGNFRLATGSGIVGSNDADSYSIQFDKNDSNNSLSTQNITFDSFIADINSLRATGDIDNFGVYVSLLSKAEVAKGVYFFAKKTSKNILNAIMNELKTQKGKHVNEDAYNILYADIQALLSTL